MAKFIFFWECRQLLCSLNPYFRGHLQIYILQSAVNHLGLQKQQSGQYAILGWLPSILGTNYIVGPEFQCSTVLVSQCSAGSIVGLQSRALHYSPYTTLHYGAVHSVRVNIAFYYQVFFHLQTFNPKLLGTSSRLDLQTARLRLQIQFVSR